MAHNNLWYVRRGRTLKGPFPAGLISRYILLDRIRLSDELSQDRTTWKPVKACVELIPDVLKADPDDEDAPRRLEAARRWADERRGEDQRVWGTAGDQPGETLEAGERRSAERRRMESEEQAQFRQIHQRLTGAPRQKQHYLLQLSMILIVVAVVIGAAMYYTPSKTINTADCTAPPGPGVNWSNCRLQGVQVSEKDLRGAHLNSTDVSGSNFAGTNLRQAVLSYADLSLANLQGADLRDAQLVGTNLRRANLAQADLRRANLAYADLTGARLTGAQLQGARLDHAIWVDGQTCQPGSLGRCLTGVPAAAPVR